jgi:hypothetical protein
MKPVMGQQPLHFGVFGSRLVGHAGQPDGFFSQVSPTEVGATRGGRGPARSRLHAPRSAGGWICRLARERHGR